jgi:hypothetical protein
MSVGGLGRVISSVLLSYLPVLLEFWCCSAPACVPPSPSTSQIPGDRPFKFSYFPFDIFIDPLFTNLTKLAGNENRGSPLFLCQSFPQISILFFVSI